MERNDFLLLILERDMTIYILWMENRPHKLHTEWCVASQREGYEIITTQTTRLKTNNSWVEEIWHSNWGIIELLFTAVFGPRTLMKFQESQRSEQKLMQPKISHTNNQSLSQSFSSYLGCQKISQTGSRETHSLISAKFKQFVSAFYIWRSVWLDIE